MVGMDDELLTMQIWSPKTLQFYDGQHFTISGAVILLCHIELTIVVCCGVEAGLFRSSLKQDSAQGLCAGVGVKLHQGVRISIVDFKDQRGTHAVL